MSRLTRKQAIKAFRQACKDLSDQGLELFGWSGTLVIVQSRSTNIRVDDIYGGTSPATGQLIVDTVTEIQCDGGDPDEQDYRGRTYLVG